MVSSHQEVSLTCCLCHFKPPSWNRTNILDQRPPSTSDAPMLRSFNTYYFGHSNLTLRGHHQLNGLQPHERTSMPFDLLGRLTSTTTESNSSTAIQCRPTPLHVTENRLVLSYALVPAPHEAVRRHRSPTTMALLDVPPRLATARILNSHLRLKLTPLHPQTHLL